MLDMPCGKRAASYFTLSEPHVTLEMPRSTHEITHRKRAMPRFTLALPRGTHDLPHFMRAEPRVTLEMPRCKRDMRRGKRSEPQVKRDMPRSMFSERLGKRDISHGTPQIRCGKRAERGLLPPVASTSSNMLRPLHHPLEACRRLGNHRLVHAEGQPNMPRPAKAPARHS